MLITRYMWLFHTVWYMEFQFDCECGEPLSEVTRGEDQRSDARFHVDWVRVGRRTQ